MDIFNILLYSYRYGYIQYILILEELWIKKLEIMRIIILEEKPIMITWKRI